MADKKMSEAELRTLLKPRRLPPQPVTKGRQWVMSDRDIAAFVKLLRKAFPTIAFIRLVNAGEPDAKWELVPCPAGRDEVYGVAGPEGWNAEEFCAQPRHLRGSLPETYFRFCGSGEPRVHTQDSGRVIENLHLSYMQASHLRSDREKARFLARVWRLSEKIATNRIKLVDKETGGTTYPSAKDGQWYGFDALAWCQQALNRVLDGHCRPTDDWVMPDSPHYDRRRRAVKLDIAAYWAGIDKLRDRIPLFSYPIGYRKSDGALVTANDIGLDVDQLIPVDELDRVRLAALIRKRWEAGEWNVYFTPDGPMTVEKAVAGLATENPRDGRSHFDLGVSKLEWAIKKLRIVPEFAQFLIPET